MAVIIINFDYNIVVSKFQKGQNKFQYGGSHAEVKGIQGIKDTNGFGADAVRYSVQFCSHLSCPSCTLIQSMEGVTNYTGFSSSLPKYIYSRDYKHLDN